MGGKQKQAQRVKNNARPSSSGRSAEFLGTAITPFSFNSMKETGFSSTPFSTSHAEIEIDASVDGNFQLVLKKMSKKDATTKLKALHEFKELVENAESEAVKAILPFWPRLFVVLATDAEHRVREATHLAHNQVVLKAKRNLAPYLKQLIGPWFTSQYDPYAPAASAACGSFKDAFPLNKMQEAIVFCQEEILMYICDNLTVHTIDSFSNAKTSNSDENKAKYERIIIASLHGYSLYFKKVPKEAIDRVEHINMKILANAKFWKLANMSPPQIKAAWYSALCAICEKATFLLAQCESNAIKAVFNHLDETDPTVQAHLWEAVLLCTKNIKEWGKYYNVEAKLLPKLWKILRERGNGNACVIYPNLLPLISNFPPMFCSQEFLMKFFDNLRAGLHLRCERNSPSENRAISVAFVECLQYCIMENHKDLELCQKMLQTHLISVIDQTIIDPNSAHKTFFNQVSALAQFWHRNKSDYEQLLAVFWTECQSLFIARLAEYAEREKRRIVKDLCDRQIEFMIAMKHNAKSKQCKVKFATEDDQPKISSRKEKRTEFCLDQTYLQSLLAFVNKVCVVYIKHVDYSSEKKIPEMIDSVVSLLQEFESVELVPLLKVAICGQCDGSLNNLFAICFAWIENDLLTRKAAVELLFLLSKYANDDEMQNLLAKITLIKSHDALGWCISTALSYPHNARKMVQTWLGNATIGQFLVDVVIAEINDTSSTDFQLLLKLAFTETNDNGDLFISKSTITMIINHLKICLEKPEAYKFTIDKCASLASYISSSIYTESSSLNGTSELFLGLFTLTCAANEITDEYISKDTLWEVKTAWQDALSILASNLQSNEFIHFTNNCSLIMERSLVGQELETNNSELVIDIITKYLLAVKRSSPRMIGLVAKAFFSRNFANEWKTQIQQLAMQANYFHGLICLTTNSDYLLDAQISLQDEHILKYFSWKLLVLNTLLTRIETDDEDDEIKDDIQLVVNLIDNSEEVLLDISLDVTVLESLLCHYKQLRKYHELQVVHSSFTAKLSAIMRNIDKTTQEALQQLLAVRLSEQSALWSPVAYVLHELQISESYSLLTKQMKTNTNRLHLTQAFSKRNELMYDVINPEMQTLEAVVTLRCLWLCDELEVQTAEVYGHIERLKMTQQSQYEGWELSNWEKMQVMIEIARFFTRSIVDNKPEGFTQRQWDLIVTSLALWCQRFPDAQNVHENPQIANFILAICELYVAVKNYIANLRVSQPKSRFIAEFENVFLKDITMEIVKIWSYFAEKFSENDTILHSQYIFLQTFGKVISHLQASVIFDSRNAEMPKWSKLLQQCCLLLIKPSHCLQLCAYHMLKVLSTGLIQVDAIAVDTNRPHAKGLIFEQFKELLVKTQTIVSEMLHDYKLGEDSCRVEPFTDSYVYTFAYLLLWDVLLRLCEKSSTELRYQYADWLRQEDLLNNLLITLFKLMPLEIFDAQSKAHISWFITIPTLEFDEPINSEKIERLNCWVYASTVAQLPAAVRQWWSNADARISQLVERVTTFYISPRLCARELQDVAEHENNFRNLKVKVHQSVREVVAVYAVDEAQMELVVMLPSNYPLGGPGVQCNREIGGLPHKQWLMQLRMCLLHQNGRIWDALSMWNNNLEKKFEGVEECYICFAVLHPGTYQLPKLSCQTCRKKFHAACLYKWFSTSNRSSCPICRNLF